MKERNHTFDLLCGLCILRMILLHTVGICGLRHEFWFGKLMAWTFFFMSFFFFKAGYFNKGVVGDFKAYFQDRVKRLLVPYLVWGLIGSLVFFGFIYGVPRLNPMAERLHWDHVYTVSHFWGNPPVWFLFSFFTTYVIIGAVHALRWHKGFSLLVPVLPFVSYWLFKAGNPLWLSLSNVPMGLFFFCLGRWYRRHPFPIVVPLLLILLFIVCNRYYHGEYDMSLNKWVQRPWGAGLGTQCALVGISGFLLRLPQKRVPVVNYIGEHSMVYFVLHYPLIHLYRFVRMSFGHTIRGHWDDCILLTLLVLCLCTWLVPYIERVPWLSGRWKK